MRKTHICAMACLAFCLYASAAAAQCPGCQIVLPDLPEDTIYLGQAPSGRVGQTYMADISFRLPRTTTPVSATDPTVPPGLTISQMTITAVSSVPSGLSWEASQLVYDPAVQSDGCVRFCGTPLAAGLYEVEVSISAQIFVFTQTTSFFFPLLIEPPISVSEGFTIVNNSGCGQVTASFVNNVPSNGQDGFSYQWNFGNGVSSTAEQPADQTYAQPGTYPVSYQAIVDTSGYFLTNVTVLNVACTDIFSGPDLKLDLFNPQGELFLITPVVNNATTPLSFQLNVPLDTGTYMIRVVDNDGGIDGPDDNCGTVSFTRLSDGAILQDGPMFLSLNILHPTDTIVSLDTITVYPIPNLPVVSGLPAGTLCAGQILSLMASYDTGLQWFRDTLPLPGAVGSQLLVDEGGAYSVLYTSPQGCVAVSPPVSVSFTALPDPAEFVNEMNLLSVTDPVALPADVVVRWLRDGALIPGATGLTYCAEASGFYELRVTSLATGCSSFYGEEVVYDPSNPGCIINDVTEAQALFGAKLWPNPASQSATVGLDLTARQHFDLRVFNAQGQLLLRQPHDLPAGPHQLSLDLLQWPAGLYQVVLQGTDTAQVLRLVKR